MITGFPSSATSIQQLLIVVGLELACLMVAHGQPAWVSPHFVVPPDTISPDGRYGVMIPDSEGGGPNKLVDEKTGALVANIVGSPGWAGNPSMRWGDMEAKWSADSTMLCWIHPGKWLQESYVVIKLRDGRAAWQVELMKAVDSEILSRTEAAAPLNFAVAKLDNADDGSAYPEGFTIGVDERQDKVSLPLVCEVSLNSNPKNDADELGENEVRASMRVTLGVDGGLTYSHLK